MTKEELYKVADGLVAAYPKGLTQWHDEANWSELVGVLARTLFEPHIYFNTYQRVCIHEAMENWQNYIFGKVAAGFGGTQESVPDATGNSAQEVPNYLKPLLEEKPLDSDVPEHVWKEFGL